MPNDTALVDTGPLVVMLRQNDPSHSLCVDAAKVLWRPMNTCWPVLTEVAWLLRGMLAAIDQLLKELELGNLRLLEIDQSAGPW